MITLVSTQCVPARVTESRQLCVSPHLHRQRRINLPSAISTITLAGIREATKQDTKLQDVTRLTQRGWPENNKELSQGFQRYFAFEDKIRFQGGILFKGERAEIPDNLRADLICQIHPSHLGVKQCLRRACNCVYWKGMNKRMKTVIAKCNTCSGSNI